MSCVTDETGTRNPEWGSYGIDIMQECVLIPSLGHDAWLWWVATFVCWRPVRYLKHGAARPHYCGKECPEGQSIMNSGRNAGYVTSDIKRQRKSYKSCKSYEKAVVWIEE